MPARWRRLSMPARWRRLLPVVTWRRRLLRILSVAGRRLRLMCERLPLRRRRGVWRVRLLTLCRRRLVILRWLSRRRLLRLRLLTAGHWRRRWLLWLMPRGRRLRRLRRGHRLPRRLESTLRSGRSSPATGMIRALRRSSLLIVHWFSLIYGRTVFTDTPALESCLAAHEDAGLEGPHQ